MLSPPGPLIRLIHRTHLFFFFINIAGKIPAFRHRPFHPAAFRPLQGALSGLQKGFVSLSDNGNVNRSDPPQRIFALAALQAGGHFHEAQRHMGLTFSFGISRRICPGS